MDGASVIVAGAGPAGCVAAYRLAQMGVDVILLEACSECPADMRASTFHAPTLEMMDELGIYEVLEGEGLKAPIYQYRNRGSGEVLSFDLTEIADVTRFPYRLQCEQFKLTRLLARMVDEHPSGRTLFSHRLVKFDQDDRGVVVSVETPHEIIKLRCDYLIGADGANSIVRKWMGCRFEGFTYPEKFMTLSTAYGIEKHFSDLANVNYIADAEEWCVLLRVPTAWRILVPVESSVEDAVLLSNARKNAIIGGLIGEPAEEISTQHRTLYSVHQRVASIYYRGRVMLIGDAAHLNNPLGGFGMNSGIHDAWNIAGRLRAILQEHADPASELARYQRQRQTVMREFVQEQTIRNKKAMEEADAEGQRRRQREFEDILADPERRRAFLLDQSMMSSRHRETELA